MNRKVKRRRRKKLKEQESSSANMETTKPKAPVHPIVIMAVEEIKQYVHYLKTLKEDHFNQARIIRIKFANDKDNLFAITIQQYLDEAILETRRRIGIVNENAIILILKDTPITPEIFSMIRSRYESYLS